jgi:hypothetical protein
VGVGITWLQGFWYRVYDIAMRHEEYSDLLRLNDAGNQKRSYFFFFLSLICIQIANCISSSPASARYLNPSLFPSAESRICNVRLICVS